MKVFKIFTAAVLTFCISTTVMANNDPIDFSALTGEYVASNPGLETVVPFWTRVDNNGDGKKDGYNFHFDIYKIGTKTKLFSTPVRYLAYTITPCSKNFIPDDHIAKDIVLNRIGNNIVLSASVRLECFTNFSSQTKQTGYIYAVNISTAGKTPWIKSFSGRLIGTGILPDKNGNGTGELSVVIEIGDSQDNQNVDDSIYVFDGETGASVATPQKYAIER